MTTKKTEPETLEDGDRELWLVEVYDELWDTHHRMFDSLPDATSWLVGVNYEDISAVRIAKVTEWTIAHNLIKDKFE